MNNQSQKILVIDDEVEIAHILKRWLSDRYEVEAVSNAAQALQFLNSPDIDLIVCDISMPKMSGYDLVKHLRQRELNTPVILISGQSGLEMQFKGLALGVAACVEKPIRKRELMDAIAFALGQSRTMAA